MRHVVPRVLAGLAAVAVLAGSTPRAGAAEPELERLRRAVGDLEEQVAALEASLAVALGALHVTRAPAAMAFAGQPVPLDGWDVAERLERELLLSLGNRGQVVLWLKRSARYFPHIEAELRQAGLPDDLKYVAVIESSLLSTAHSPAQALGIWQFIPATGRRYGLGITAAWDERRNPERSTAAALAYLRDLHAQFRDWPLALAAYNAGEARVDQALRRQGVTTYYQLTLPVETERYVFRALAAKLVLADPERYGFQVPAELRYRPHETDVVKLVLRDAVPLAVLARRYGSFPRELRQLNPEIIQDPLPRGAYSLRVPKGSAVEVATRDGRGR
jgi:membrane-bound lytic murein transglycosylase D